jgi:hypothetical protein
VQRQRPVTSACVFSIRECEACVNVNLTLLARERCLSAENTRNAVLARQTQEKERIPRDKRSFHGRHYREPQLALQCLKASCKEEQVGVTRAARRHRDALLYAGVAESCCVLGPSPAPHAWVVTPARTQGGRVGGVLISILSGVSAPRIWGRYWNRGVCNCAMCVDKW